VQLVSSAANLYNAFRTGAIDLALQGLAIEQISNLQKTSAQDGWRMLEQAGSGIDVLVLNLKSPPLEQKKVRQAIAAIMDRPLLQERVFSGQVDPLYSLIPQQMDDQVPVFKEIYGDLNTAKAKALLQQAGYSASNPLVLELWYRSNLVNDQLAALTLKAIVEKSLEGWMRFELNSVESTSAYNNLDKGVYPLFILDWTGDYFDPDTYIYPFLDCTKGSIDHGCEEGQSASWGSFYFSERANQLIAQSRWLQNPVQRKQVFKQLQELSAIDVPYIPLWQSKDYLFVQKGIEGARLEVTQKVPFWTLSKASATQSR
jgi:peptide/nickel transport system substrate-binding protein